MSEDQSSLSDFGGGVEQQPDGETPGGNGGKNGVRRLTIALREAPDNAEPFADDSCPWCLGSADDFVTKTNDDVPGELPQSPQVSCGHCSAVIPVHMDWYQRGEKICF